MIKSVVDIGLLLGCGLDNNSFEEPYVFVNPLLAPFVIRTYHPNKIALMA
jgi:hypothetical protein